jgi:hypothetical protein
VTAADGQGRISRKERMARAAAGMPAEHPELITRKPSHAEWTELAIRLAELWPNDEYDAAALRGARNSGTTDGSSAD